MEEGGKGPPLQGNGFASFGSFLLQAIPPGSDPQPEQEGLCRDQSGAWSSRGALLGVWGGLGLCGCRAPRVVSERGAPGAAWFPVAPWCLLLSAGGKASVLRRGYGGCGMTQEGSREPLAESCWGAGRC